ncbi:MAG TPA: glycosyltransferase [Kofleriaceae bacterium]|nr:glycosyltransferase [Kofleriaceae bacterium]
MAPIRVLFFTTHLGGGGAEMQAVRVANQLDPAAFEVHVAVCRRGGAYERLLRPTVRLHHLAPARIRSSTAGLVLGAWPLRRLARALAPDVVCSFMDGANVVAALAVGRRGDRPRVVACVQNTISQELGTSRHPVKRTVRALIQRTYPRVDRIVALSRGVAADLIDNVPDTAAHVSVIYNAGLDDQLAARAAQPLDDDAPAIPRPLVVACGRLAHQKGYPHLLDAFVRVRRETGAHLWILGEGPDRAAIEAQIARLGLGDAVRLLGFRKNPYPYMAAADLFVLPSLYEGFGNVVVEAMAVGTPVVASDCPHGPGEIITDGVNGLLVPPAAPAPLAAAMIRVLGDPALARALAERGQARAQDFHVDKIGAAYAALLRGVTTGTSLDTPPAFT